MRLLSDTDAPPHLVRWTDDDRLLIAGADQSRPPVRTRERTLIQRTGQLMYELSRLYPDVSGIQPTHGWDLPLAVAGIGGGMRNAFQIMMMMPQVKSGNGESAWDDLQVGGGQQHDGTNHDAQARSVTVNPR